jgi:hypothetical protein
MAKPYANPPLPHLTPCSGANPDRSIIDAAKLDIAQQVAAVWDVDVETVYHGVDAGALR